MFFTDYEGYTELKSLFKFKPLIDLAHLKVSCNTLGLNFYDQCEKLLCESDLSTQVNY